MDTRVFSFCSFVQLAQQKFHVIIYQKDTVENFEVEIEGRLLEGSE
jgi:hypothetical protein